MCRRQWWRVVVWVVPCVAAVFAVAVLWALRRDLREVLRGFFR